MNACMNEWGGSGWLIVYSFFSFSFWWFEVGDDGIENGDAA